ncbi:M60 family metallopeptidase [Pseudomonas sp. MDT1-17]
MNSIIENFSNALQPVELVVTDEKSILRADAEVDADAARKSEGRWFNHSNLQPTGRYARKGTQLNVIVSPLLSGLELVIGLFGNYGEHNGGEEKSHARFALNPGANVIVAPLDGMIYIQNRIFNTVATVEVSGGEPVPTYIKGVTTNADFRAQVNRWKTAPFVELIGDYVIGDFQSRRALPGLLDIDLDRRIGMFDAVVAHTNALYGLSKYAYDVAHKSSNRIYIANPDTGAGYASATDGRITFQVNSGAGAAILTGPENDMWGLYHEVGHTYQPEARWAGMGEVSVNLSSLAVQEALGFPNTLDDTPTRNAVAEFRKTPIADRNYSSISNVWLKLLMLDQLRRGFGGNFYAQLSQQFRIENSAGIPEPETAPAVQRHFMLTAGKVANRNLTRFFEEWGMPLDAATRSELAKLPELKHEIWNNMNRPTDVIERDAPPLMVPATLTSPAGGSFGESHAPLYEGTGSPGATVTIEQGLPGGRWHPVGTTTVKDSGNWSLQGLPLPAGEREARATLSNGGTGFARNTFTVKEVADVIPVTMTSPKPGATFDVNHEPLYAGKGTREAWSKSRRV